MDNQVVVFNEQGKSIDKILKVETREIGGVKQDTVNARGLHVLLGSKREFANWIKNRLEQNSCFEDDLDYSSFDEVVKRETGATTKKEYVLTIEMAKELAMLENNPIGRAIRRHFIARDMILRTVDATALFNDVTKLYTRKTAIYQKAGFSKLEALKMSRERMLEETKVDYFLLYPEIAAMIEFKENSFSIPEAAKLLNIHPVVIKNLLQSTGVYFKIHVFSNGYAAVKHSTGGNSGPYISSEPGTGKFLLNKLGIEMLAHVNKNGFRDWDFKTHQARPEQNLIEM